MNKEPILLLFGHNVQKYRKELGLSQYIFRSIPVHFPAAY